MMMMMMMMIMVMMMIHSFIHSPSELPGQHKVKSAELLIAWNSGQWAFTRHGQNLRLNSPHE